MVDECGQCKTLLVYLRLGNHSSNHQVTRPRACTQPECKMDMKSPNSGSGSSTSSESFDDVEMKNWKGAGRFKMPSLSVRDTVSV